MTDNDDITTDSKRRDFLKALGATGIAGAGFAGSANASTPSREIVEVTGSTADRLAEIASRDGEFRALSAELNGRPGTTVRPDDYGVLRVTEAQSGETWHVVDFGVDDAAGVDSSISVTVQGGAVVGASAAVTRISDGVPAEVEVFEADGDVVTSESAEVFDGDVSAQYSVCDFCHDVVGVACALGCGWGTTAICAALSLSVVGGVACASIAITVCYFIGKYGCGYGADTICTWAGYC